MENYFILLELPFDLPESDTNKISEAISKKQAQWSRDQSNPVKKAKASEYLAALEDIKKVMLDPTARKQEAAKAKQIKASKAKELEAKLSLYRAKGDELSEKDLKRLVKVFGAFGFTADEIKKKFGSGNKKQDKIDPSEVLDKTQARNVQNLEEKIGETAAQQYLAENAKTCKSYMDARDAVCRNFLEEYGAGNFVRTAEAKFKTVRYFTCSALGHNHEGQPYEGKNVVDPVMWLLQQADSSIKAE